MRRPSIRWAVRLGAACCIAGALAYIPYRVGGSEGVKHYQAMKRERVALEERNARLEAGNAALRSAVRRLRTDPEAIATVARDELGMVGEGEIVVRIETDAGEAR